MDMTKAWDIVGEYSSRDTLSEDDSILLEEALNYILIEALIRNEKSRYYLWENDIIAGSWNLAAYYEKIGKYELAHKYYNLSKEYEL